MLQYHPSQILNPEFPMSAVAENVSTEMPAPILFTDSAAAKVAEAMGLPQGIPVVTGLPDLRVQMVCTPGPLFTCGALSPLRIDISMPDMSIVPWPMAEWSIWLWSMAMPPVMVARTSSAGAKVKSCPFCFMR